jgi:hypothetical protein
VHKKNSVLSSERERDRVIEHSVRRSSVMCASSKRRTLGGQEEFLFEKSFGYEFIEIPETQGVRGSSKYSQRPSSGEIALFRSVVEVQEMDSQEA